MSRSSPVTCFLLFAWIFLFLHPSSFAQPVVSAKAVEKNMVRVKDSLYASCYEVSNAEYKVFLKEMLMKDSSLYWSYRSDSAQWWVVLQPCGGEMPLWYHLHPGFNNHPVVAISYEGAAEYCKWLTETYNKDPKRKFRNAIFVLPSKEEWTLAAEGNWAGVKYPWGNQLSMMDKKGQYRCNMKYISETMITSDSLGQPVFRGSWATDYFSTSMIQGGAFYTAEVNAYEPNGLGIYNVCGNVAEMVNTKTYAMGGSWNSYGGEVTTTSMKQYGDPSPEVGFRVFMKIIEQ